MLTRTAPIALLLACTGDKPSTPDDTPATDTDTVVDTPQDTDAPKDTDEPVDTGDTGGPTDTGAPGPAWAWQANQGPGGGSFQLMGEAGGATYVLSFDYDNSKKVLMRQDDPGGDWTELALSSVVASKYALNGLHGSSSELFWVTDYDGVYLSTDQGASWADASPPWTDGYVAGVYGYIKSADWVDGSLYIVREVSDYNDPKNNRGELRTYTSGKWSTITLPREDMAITMLPSAWHAHVNNYPDDNEHCYSTDKGVSWTCHAQSLEMYPQYLEDSSGDLFVASYGFIGTSTDSGETWTELAAPDYVYKPLLHDGWIYFIDDDEQVNRVSLSDGSQELLGAPFDGNLSWNHLGVINDEVVLANMLGLGALQKDGTWLNRSPLLAPLPRVLLDPDGVMWGLDEFKQLTFSADGGDSWDRRPALEPGWGDTHAIFSDLALVDGTLFLGGDHGRVWRGEGLAEGTDGLVTDQVQDAGTEAVAIAQDGAYVLAGFFGDTDVNHGTGAHYDFGGGVYRYDLTAETWSAASSGLPPRSHGGDASISHIAAHGGVALASTQAGLYYSTDHGGSWRQATGLPLYDGDAERTRLVAFEKTLYLARQAPEGIRLYASSTQGTSWVLVDDGWPASVTLGDLAVFQGELLLGAMSGGVWGSTDGESWSEVGDLEVGVYDLDVTADRILAATEAGTWWYSED